MSTIKVKFTCKGCGLTEQECVVAAREDPDKVDVVVYVQAVRIAVEMHHKLLSPNCTCREVDLLIPFDKDDPDSWVGKPAAQRSD
jgi:hypothetical protein